MRKGKLLLNLDFANLYSIFYCCLCAFLKPESWYYSSFEAVKISIAGM